MDQEAASGGDRERIHNQHDLPLFFAPELHSPSEQEFELIPIIEQQHIAERIREYIGSQSKKSSPTKQHRAINDWGMLQAVSSTEAKLVSSNHDKTMHLAPKHKSSSQASISNVASNSMHTNIQESMSHNYDTRSEWSPPLYQNGLEILPTTTYVRHEEAARPKKNYSEVMGVPSPTYPYATLGEGGNHGGDASFEAMIRQGLYSPGDNIDEDGYYLSSSPRSPGFPVKLDSVNAQEPRVEQGRRAIDSAHALVYNSDPFGIALASADSNDLSMHATLFPSSSSPVAKTAKRTQPDTPTSEAGSSINGHSSEDDMVIITKDFHHALTSIATQEKALPRPPTYASAKAMSLLGQSGPSLQRKDPSLHIKNKPAPLNLQGANSNFAATRDQIIKNELGATQKQQLKDVLTALTKGATLAATKSSSRTSALRPSKIESVLGMNGVAARGSLHLPPPETSGNGPRTNSTLYKKLYSQVSKPMGASPTKSTFSGFTDIYNGRPAQRNSTFDNTLDPVKRSSESPNNTIFPRKMFPASPAGSFDTSYSWGNKDRHQSAQVSPLKIVKNRIANQESGNARHSKDNRSITIDSAIFNGGRSGQAGFGNGHQQQSSRLESALSALYGFENGHHSEMSGLSNGLGNRLTFQDMAGLSTNLRDSIAHGYDGHQACGHTGRNVSPSSRTDDARDRSPSSIRRTISQQQIDGARSTSGYHLANPPVMFPAGMQSRQPSYGSITSTSFAAPIDDTPIKRPKSPVKKMFSSAVNMINQIIPTSNQPNMITSSNGIVNSPADLKISVHPADQNRLFGDLEYIIQDTANRFLLYQHQHGRLSLSSVDKIARTWHAKNRPQVAQFLYPIGTQREVVEANLSTIRFLGPLAGNPSAIQAIMHTWKYVARELNIRSFCLPDAGLQHFLRETARLLELLGVAEGHMLHFQAWSNLVTKTVHGSYFVPYSNHQVSGEGY